MDTQDFGRGIEKKTIKKYNRTGKPVTTDGELVYAQTTELLYYDKRKEKTYSVLTLNGILYDPFGIDGHRNAGRMGVKLRTTTQAVLDSYMKYLITKNKIHITKANRSFIYV
jgi:hypothetical protein